MTFEDASDGFRFGAAVAEFAEILRDSMHVDDADLGLVQEVASDASSGSDKEVEFIGLVEKAKAMK